MKNYKNRFLSISLFCALYILAYIPQVKAQPYPGITVNSQLFNDNIWFFGALGHNNETWAECPSVTFVKDASDKWIPQSLPSGKRGKVASWENSLSVSTPSCDGDFIFYTMHNQVYNSEHTKMQGGNFDGHTSVADGLAACYVGNNKYFLFTCTAPYGSTIALRYYTINMGSDQDGGRGVMSSGTNIQASGVSESIEVIPAATGNDNEYWLVYHDYGAKQMVVKKVTPSGITDHRRIDIDVFSAATYTYVLKSNATYNRLVMSGPSAGVFLFHFNPVTGDIAYDKQLPIATNFAGSYYGAEFSPLGTYVYFASYTYSNDNSYRMHQYDIDNNKLIGSFNYNNTRLVNCIGSGLKRGPDGKMYVARAGTKYLGVIETPDLPVTSSSFKYTLNGVDVGIVYDNLPLSTGITPPAKDPLSITKPPTTKPDAATTTNTMPVNISVLNNDTYNNGDALHVSSVFFTDPSKSTQGTIKIDPTKTQVIFSPNLSYPFINGEKVNITYVAKDNGKPIPMCNSEQIEITVRIPEPPKSTLFSDDVWFFGGGTPGSPGLIFKDDGNGGKVVTNASGISKCASGENSLSVSTPSCDGSFIFYTDHSTIYNSAHVKMKDGTFNGNNWVGDGLAACYIGDNKYMLFSASTAYENNGGAGGKLTYNIVDMGKEDGKGQLITPADTEIETAGASEVVELVPIPDTYDQYWLIYYHIGSKEMRVRKIEGSVISAVVHRLSYTAGPFMLKRNPQGSLLAMTDGTYNSLGAHRVNLFNFNPYTGDISLNRTLDAEQLKTIIYHLEFSPNGRYLYVTSWSNRKLTQYDLTTNAIVHTLDFTTTNGGGGIKLGPDGKIYVVRMSSRYLGVIANPNNPLSAAEYNITGFDLGINNTGGALSTGLTPPYIDPPGTNQPPIAKPDAVNAYTLVPTVIHPLADDEINPSSNANNLYLINAELANSADVGKGTVTFDEAAKTVTFTPTPGYTFADNETIVISYEIRDDQTPVSLCEKSTITLTMVKPQLTITVPSPKQFDEGTKPSLTVCLPSDIGTRTSNLSVNLAQVTSTMPMATSGDDYTMPGTVTIPAGSNCAPFEVDIKSDPLIEGSETLKIEASATNCQKGSDELIIIDKTNGLIEVVAIPTSVNEGVVAKFQIRFKDDNVTCTWDVDVEYEIDPSSTATSPNHYTLSPSSPIKLNKANHSVDVIVTTNNNFVVEGDKDIKLKIKNPTPATRP